MENNRIENVQYEKARDEMQCFIDGFNSLNEENSKEVIFSFEENHKQWFSIVPYMQDTKPYADCLAKYLEALAYSPTYKNLQSITSYIEEYENYESAEHRYFIPLFANLGITWHKFGKEFDNFAVESFKKYLFYLLGISSHTSYNPVCFTFKKCSALLYQRLIKEQINISSPVMFNDPFDSPIISLLDKDDEISTLVKRAYLDCIKIGCFVCNIKQPYHKSNLVSEPVYNEPKHKNDLPEYKNELMWAHYADSHRGICIKYHFSNSLTKLYSKVGKPVRYFRDVEYKDDLSVLNIGDTITIKDAFFAKSKAWEYENELRLIQFDLNGSGNYDVIDVPSSIEAVYFGAKCSQEDKDCIMEIMKDKNYLSEGREMVDGKERVWQNKSSIRFYQMKFDEKKFGTLKADKINT